MQATQVVREKEQNLRREVSARAQEAGLRALVELALIEREKALREWRAARGDDLVKYQTQYNAMQAVIDFVQKPPREFEVQQERGSK